MYNPAKGQYDLGRTGEAAAKEAASKAAKEAASKAASAASKAASSSTASKVSNTTSNNSDGYWVTHPDGTKDWATYSKPAEAAKGNFYNPAAGQYDLGRKGEAATNPNYAAEKAAQKAAGRMARNASATTSTVSKATNTTTNSSSSTSSSSYRPTSSDKSVVVGPDGKISEVSNVVKTSDGKTLTYTGGAKYNSQTGKMEGIYADNNGYVGTYSSDTYSGKSSFNKEASYNKEYDKRTIGDKVTISGKTYTYTGDNKYVDSTGKQYKTYYDSMDGKQHITSAGSSKAATVTKAASTAASTSNSSVSKPARNTEYDALEHIPGHPDSKLTGNFDNYNNPIYKKADGTLYAYDERNNTMSKVIKAADGSYFNDMYKKDANGNEIFVKDGKYYSYDKKGNKLIQQQNNNSNDLTSNRNVINTDSQNNGKAVLNNSKPTTKIEHGFVVSRDENGTVIRAVDPNNGKDYTLRYMELAGYDFQKDENGNIIRIVDPKKEHTYIIQTPLTTATNDAKNEQKNSRTEETVGKQTIEDPNIIKSKVTQQKINEAAINKAEENRANMIAGIKQNSANMEDLKKYGYTYEEATGNLNDAKRRLEILEKEHANPAWGNLSQDMKTKWSNEYTQAQKDITYWESQQASAAKYEITEKTRITNNIVGYTQEEYYTTLRERIKNETNIDVEIASDADLNNLLKVYTNEYCESNRNINDLNMLVPFVENIANGDKKLTINYKKIQEQSLYDSKMCMEFVGDLIRTRKGLNNAHLTENSNK